MRSAESRISLGASSGIGADHSKMKRFDIITESDARVLARGETVILASAGHVTPLAQDTLRARRVTILREGQVSVDDAALVPRADIRSLAIASDHAGTAL